MGYSLQSSDIDISECREELLGYLEEMADFRNWDPQEVFLKLSASSARASYMRNKICQREDRIKRAFRTSELDPFIEEVERQFKIWSRLLSYQNLDWEMARGQ